MTIKKDPRGRKPKVEQVRKMIQLRKSGLTWKKIGEKFGVTRQAASQLVKRATKV